MLNIYITKLFKFNLMLLINMSSYKTYDLMHTAHDLFMRWILYIIYPFSIILFITYFLTS